MLREFAAPFRAMVCRPAPTPFAAAGTDRAVAPQRRMARVGGALAMVLSGALLCGCGIKGPLRPLPTATAAPAVAPADPAAAPAPSASPAVVDPPAKPKP
jgi:predicted small lipoprotein YifL